MSQPPLARRRRAIREPRPQASAQPSSPALTQSPHSRQFLILRFLAFVMLAVTSVDLAKGCLDLLASPIGGVDLRLRWEEQRYVLNRQNPFDVLQAAGVFPGYGAPSWSPRNSDVIPEVGVPVGTTYPPWSYFFGNILYWPPLYCLRAYFAFIEVLSLVYLFRYAYSVGRRKGSHNASLILALSAISISSVTTTISLGQFGLLAVAALAATESLTYKRRPILAGLALAFALAKPNIAGLFLLPFIIRLAMPSHRRNAALTLGTAAALVILATVVTGWQTHTNPIEMTLQWLGIAKFLVLERVSFIASLQSLGLSQASATKVALIGCSTIAILLIALWRRSDLLVQFAIACLAGRLWSYHRMYDNVMLAFLFIALARLAFVQQNRRALIAYVLTGITLWIPVHFVGAFVADTQRLIWALGLYVVLKESSEESVLASSVVK